MKIFQATFERNVFVALVTDGCIQTSFFQGFNAPFRYFSEDTLTHALCSLMTSDSLSHGRSIFHIYQEPSIKSYIYGLGISIHQVAPESHHPCAQ